jgi:hypothetical protein
MLLFHQLAQQLWFGEKVTSCYLGTQVQDVVWLDIVLVAILLVIEHFGRNKGLHLLLGCSIEVQVILSNDRAIMVSGVENLQS